MLGQATKDALLLSHGQAKKATDKPLAAGETRVAAKDWDVLTVACKGEPSLFAALKVTDARGAAR